MEILQRQNETKGSFYVKENGKVLAEMTYSVVAPSLIIIDHTDVDESLKDKGVGLKLLNKNGRLCQDKQYKDHSALPFCKICV